MNNQTANPFGGNAITLPQQANSLIESESQRSVAEVQSAMVIAKKFPRDPVKSMDRILNACQRPSLASTSIYQYSRGGASISGPSIRLAEAMAQQWGNVQYGIRELSQNNGESTVEAFAWDVETNTKQVKVFQVPHVRYTRNGTKKLTDPRDIYETVANNGARRLRACILGIIPSDVVEAAVNQCYQTMQANVDCSPGRVKKLVERFEEYGITREAIEKRIQCRIDAIKPAQMISLISIGESLRDGMGSPSDFFDIKQETKTAAGITDAVTKALEAGPVETKPSEFENLMNNVKACKTLEDIERMKGVIADKASDFAQPDLHLLSDTLDMVAEEIGAEG